MKKLTLAALIAVLFSTSGIAAKKDNKLNSALGSISYSKFEVIFKKGSETEDAYVRYKKMEAIRGNAQKSLERLMKKRKSAELMVRYGEMMLQRGRDQETFALELEMDGKSKEAAKLKASSKKLLRSGLSMHAKTLKSLKNKNLKAEVYLGMAKTERQLGKHQRAINYANLGLKQGKNIPGPIQKGLHLVLADAAFDKAQGGRALEHYRKALKFVRGEGLEKSYLYYKIAWTQYNLKDPVESLKTLRRLIDKNQDRFALKQEAIRDYGLMASDLSPKELKESGGVAGIYSYLKKSSNTDLPEKAVERMAKSFASNGRRQDAIDTMMHVISEAPTDKYNVDRALSVIEWEKSLAKKERLKDRYMWLLAKFGPSSDWYRGQEHDVQKVSFDKVESSIRLYSNKLHEQALKQKNKESRDENLMVVARLYDAHLKEFSNEPTLYYYRAEIHRYFSEWKDAGVKFDKYLSLLKPLEKVGLSAFNKKTKKEVLSSAVDVWERAFKRNDKYVVEYIDACDRFVSENPKHPKSAQVMYASSEAAYKVKNTGGALTRLNRIVSEYPKTKQSVDAVNTALDIYNKDNDWVNLATNARQWINKIGTWAPTKDAPKVKAELQKILSQTELKACDELSKSSDKYLEAALCFKSYANGFSTSPKAVQALMKSAQLYKKTGRVTAEMDTLEGLVKKYPKSDEAEEAFGKLATAYEKSFQFEKATEIYEVLVSRPKLKDRNLFLERLLVLLQGVGKRDTLAKWLQDKSVKKSLKKEIMATDYRQMFNTLREEELANGYVKGNFASRKAQDIYKRLKAANAKNELDFAQFLEIQRYKGNLLREKGKLGEADKQWMKGLKAFWKKKGRTDADWEAAARLRLDQSTFWLVQFERVNLKANPQKKVELFTKLEGWYAEVIKMKSPTVALEALWKSASLYESFSKELAALPETQEQAKALAAKGKLAMEQLSTRARSWKIVSPAIIAAISASRGPASTTQALRSEFPWDKLPLWLEPSKTWDKMSEWSMSNKEVSEALAKASNDRGTLRNLALVDVVRRGDYSNNQSKVWISTLGDKESIQLRIQALINEKEYHLANLYLDQYQELFKKDAFVSHMAGKIMWARGDYKSAQDYWVSKNRYNGDFHTVYWKLGWDYTFANLGVKEQQSLSDDAFDDLKDVAKMPWQKVYLSSLCVNNHIKCPESYMKKDVFTTLSQDLSKYYEYQTAQSANAHNTKVFAIEALFENRLNKAKELGELKPYKEVLSHLWDMQDHETSKKIAKVTYKKLKKMLNAKQVEIEKSLKNKLLANNKRKTP
jgi:TolA-binding protein